MHCPFPKLMVRAQKALMALVNLPWCLYPHPHPKELHFSFWSLHLSCANGVVISCPCLCHLFLAGGNLKTGFLALTLHPQLLNQILTWGLAPRPTSSPWCCLACWAFCWTYQPPCPARLAPALWDGGKPRWLWAPRSSPPLGSSPARDAPSW